MARSSRAGRLIPRQTGSYSTTYTTTSDDLTRPIRPSGRQPTYPPASRLGDNRHPVEPENPGSVPLFSRLLSHMYRYRCKCRGAPWRWARLWGDATRAGELKWGRFIGPMRYQVVVERARARRGGEAGDVIGSRLCKAGGYTMGHTTPSRARNQSICTHPSHTGSRVRYHNLPPTRPAGHRRVTSSHSGVSKTIVRSLHESPHGRSLGHLHA